MNLHTGEPGFGFWHDGEGVKDDLDVFKGGDIDVPEQRAGVLYFGIGELRLGWNSEGIRHFFQNRMVHDRLFWYNYGEKYPWVLKIDKEASFYWQIGNGSGNTTW